MRVDPGHVPPPAPPMAQDPPGPRPGQDPRQARPWKAWSLVPERDPIDYDDDAWM